MINKKFNNQTEKRIDEIFEDYKKNGFSNRFKKEFLFFWISFFILVGSFMTFSHYLVPERIYLPMNLFQPIFWIETFLWLGVSMLSAHVTYVGAYGALPSRHVVIALLFFIISILGFIFFDLWGPDFFKPLKVEMDYLRGPCGGFIFSAGLLTTLVFSKIIKKGVIQSVGLTSVATALSVGSICSLFMHLFCPHEGGAHLLIWHMTPLFVLSGVILYFSKKIFS